MSRQPSRDRHGARGGRVPAPLRTAAERLALGAVAGLATALVLLWGGLAWHTARLAGAGAAVVVALAAWAASTVPPPSQPRSLPGSDAPRRPDRTDRDRQGP
ncbi:hypothetical protein [Cellulomonas chengniuliangii]|uniref:Uncharacterized protein n=1 Tax=Cellulomonas chengniuliangii TaxID=2968084 RepID=A0ABY5KX84_9CELL|nr:hypothetical protein [Cellulomonas chengniuliangii]MCC2308951.1 hypothetical protein [Cellulomonas chengniuliangii]MCC2319485.1 hypothetical protein [Cellulomonas chengniuliangii]UUI74313.1 hypothetical protein NP064_10890 [Cellulomonas chengniuliangii]